MSKTLSPEDRVPFYRLQGRLSKLTTCLAVGSRSLTGHHSGIFASFISDYMMYVSIPPPVDLNDWRVRERHGARLLKLQMHDPRFDAPGLKQRANLFERVVHQSLQRFKFRLLGNL